MKLTFREYLAQEWETIKNMGINVAQLLWLFFVWYLIYVCGAFGVPR